MKTSPGPQKRPEEKASLIHTNLTYSKSLKKALILLLAFIEKSKKWVMMEEMTIVKDFVRKVRPKQVVPAVLRYETKPGIQAQVDWGEVRKG